jgi:hypothetical protein
MDEQVVVLSPIKAICNSKPVKHSVATFPSAFRHRCKSPLPNSLGGIEVPARQRCQSGTKASRNSIHRIKIDDIKQPCAYIP